MSEFKLRIAVLGPLSCVTNALKTSSQVDPWIEICIGCDGKFVAKDEGQQM